MPEANEAPPSARQFDLDQVVLDPEKILVQDLGGGFYIFTTETEGEGRKIGYETGKSVLKQRGAASYTDQDAESFLGGLRDPEPINDYRLDGYELSCSIKEQPKEKVWETKIVAKYPTPDDLTQLQTAVQQLGFGKKQ